MDARRVERCRRRNGIVITWISGQVSGSRGRIEWSLLCRPAVAASPGGRLFQFAENQVAAITTAKSTCLPIVGRQRCLSLRSASQIPECEGSLPGFQLFQHRLPSRIGVRKDRIEGAPVWHSAPRGRTGSGSNPNSARFQTFCRIVFLENPSILRN